MYSSDVGHLVYCSILEYTEFTISTRAFFVNALFVIHCIVFLLNIFGISIVLVQSAGGGGDRLVDVSVTASLGLVCADIRP